jgi:N-acylneuraminate cytidylyltransferase
LAIIPARGGSKGLPGKNIRPLRGKPLIGWSLDAAWSSRYVSEIVVSSDDPEILSVAQGLGDHVSLVRPAELARDDSSSIDVVLQVLDTLPDYDWVVLLQPTSPLRTAADIDAALEQCWATGAPACVSVSVSVDSPWWMFGINAQGRLHAFLPPEQRPMRRQDLPELYSLNGAVYVARVDWLRQTRSFLGEETVAAVMPTERAVDIDTLHDFHLAECLMGRLAE